ncbi:hypothetical protein J8G26_08905 [Acidovorax sp. JG5]|uniref:hypothetical protein n=1 Tax=Acidovorax sp. JG5 TaxID=2822718 RepID=UPI001B32CEE4|nr:hypothetical protein [Acidovorax sp. JG5]MBP3980845.1 hypothetical protein [Acidovorax sp. JG5]
MSEKICRKCGHTTTYSGMEPQSCTACGAIYRKVEEALQQAAQERAERAARPSLAPSRVAASIPTDHHAYAAELRSDSLYPTWRQLVTVFTIFWYVVAVAVGIGGLIAFKNSFMAGLSGLGVAVLIAIFAKVGKELSLMLADLSDATVRLAAKAQADLSS